MACYAGGGKNTVEGCRFVDALDLRRKGYLQPPAPGKPPYAVTANCGGRDQPIATSWTRSRLFVQRQLAQSLRRANLDAARWGDRHGLDREAYRVES